LQGARSANDYQARTLSYARSDKFGALKGLESEEGLTPLSRLFNFISSENGIFYCIFYA